MAAIFRKTDKGMLELETRAHRLRPRLRSALILVDGRKSDADLAKLIPVEPQATLAALLAEGYIEVAAVNAERPSRAKTTAGSRRRSATFDEVRLAAMRQLSALLGPDAESLNAEIDRARTIPELKALLSRAALRLRRLHSEASAEAFSARFLAPPKT
jgi:hypothetical protein